LWRGSREVTGPEAKSALLRPSCDEKKNQWLASISHSSLIIRHGSSIITIFPRRQQFGVGCASSDVLSISANSITKENPTLALNLGVHSLLTQPRHYDRVHQRI